MCSKINPLIAAILNEHEGITVSSKNNTMAVKTRYRAQSELVSRCVLLRVYVCVRVCVFFSE